jgi:hypothetical protein
MPVPWRAIVALLLAIGLSTSGATAVVACSCAEGSPEAHLAGADVVVEGVVVATDDPFAWLPMMSSADPIGYRVAVERSAARGAARAVGPSLPSGSAGVSTPTKPTAGCGYRSAPATSCSAPPPNPEARVPGMARHRRSAG